MARGDRHGAILVVRHAIEAMVVLAWVIGVCRMPFWTYFICFAYAGTALALVRSFAEHRAELAVEWRTAIVERSVDFRAAVSVQQSARRAPSARVDALVASCRPGIEPIARR